LIGSGDNPLNIVFANDVADGIIRAANHPAAIGQVYILGAVEKFTQRQFIGALTDALGQPPLERHLPYWFAFRLGFVVESVGKALRVQRNLRVTRHGVSLMGSSIGISSDKARAQLGWVPKVAPLDGLKRTVEWYFGPGGGKVLANGDKANSWLKRCLRSVFKKPLPSDPVTQNNSAT
ncbi:MAG TPA: hypothetical protein VE988_18010, partial [Gemmataceae bacterium]|nr:hypothetical protein [Gemmataceae bacterium]